MAQTKTIQLLRSSSVAASLEAAKTAIQTAGGTRKDGELLLGRYWSGTGSSAVIKSVIGIYHANPDLTPAEGETITAGWTFIQDITSSSEGLQHLQNEVDLIETALGFNDAGTKPDFDTTNQDVILASDDVVAAIQKVANAIAGMDKAASAVNGQVVTTVSETNGVVSETKANVKDLQLGGYSKDTSATGAIGSTDTVNTALSKLENAIAANDVHSDDQSITVTDDVDGGTNIEVNVDAATIVKDGTSNALKSGLTIAKITTGLSTNVKEAYQLQDANHAQIGAQIDIYKDSALKEVYLGASTDTIDSSTGVITKNTVTDPQSMNFAYQLADGTYSLVKIDVSKFLTESEFSDGLQVNGGVVSVKKDTSSGKVRTAATPPGATPGSADDTGLVDVLTVSSNGVKVDNIQAAIDYAVQNSSTSLAISAEGDDYITAAVDANNNKKINVTADVQDLTATAGTPGVYDSTTGAQTTAPVAGTLTGVADSLTDGDDVATKVKTYVDGAIAIEAARSDAKNLVDLKTVVEGLDGTATASSATNLDTTPSADFKVLTKVAEVDGKVVETTVTNGSTAVTLKKLAATGAAADVSIADAGGLITATTVEGALQEIAGNVQNVAIVSNDVIVATPDTANHNTKLSVTTGNGLEKTGTNNDTLSVKEGDGITVDANGVAVDAGLGLEINSTSNAVDIKIDSTSAKLGDGTDGMLTVSANGLKLADTWDCGTF